MYGLRYLSVPQPVVGIYAPRPGPSSMLTFGAAERDWIAGSMEAAGITERFRVSQVDSTRHPKLLRSPYLFRGTIRRIHLIQDYYSRRIEPSSFSGLPCSQWLPPPTSPSYSSTRRATFQMPCSSSRSLAPASSPTSASSVPPREARLPSPSRRYRPSCLRQKARSLPSRLRTSRRVFIGPI